jgi:hypothetical protein
MRTIITEVNLNVPAMTRDGQIAVDYSWNDSKTVAFPVLKRTKIAHCCVTQSHGEILTTFHGPDGLYHILAGNPPRLPFVSRFLTELKAIEYGFISKPLPMCDETEWRDPKQCTSEFLHTIGSSD